MSRNMDNLGSDTDEENLCQKRRIMATPPLVKYFSDEECSISSSDNEEEGSRRLKKLEFDHEDDDDDEDYDGHGHLLTLNIGNGNGNGLEVVEQRTKNNHQHQVAVSEEKKKDPNCMSNGLDSRGEKSAENNSRSSNSSKNQGCGNFAKRADTNTISMDRIQREWVQHQQIFRSKKLKIESVKKHQEKMATMAYHGNAPLFWHDKTGEDCEIALPSSASTSSFNSPCPTGDDDGSPEHTYTSSTAEPPSNTNSYEIQQLRFEMDKLMQNNCLLMAHNASLIQTQAALIHLDNLKQAVVNELNNATMVLHLNQMQQLHALQHQQQNYFGGHVGFTIPSSYLPAAPMPIMTLPNKPAPPIMCGYGGGEHFYFNNATNVNVRPGFQRGVFPHSREEQQKSSGGPNCWNVKDCHSELFISPDGLILYKRAHLFVNDFASVRAELPIKQKTQQQENYVPAGFFYFEVKILQRNNRIWVGLSTKQLKVTNSLGYTHGCGWGFANFGCFYEDGRVRAYGEHFDTDDVIGSGVDLQTGEIFFTKNGTSLGKATKIPITEETDGSEYFPTITICAPGSSVKANFGQEKFLYIFEK